MADRRLYVTERTGEILCPHCDSTIIPNDYYDTSGRYRCPYCAKDYELEIVALYRARQATTAENLHSRE